MSEPVLDVKEAAAALGLKVGTLYSLAARGLVPSHRLGRQRRFIVEEILEATKQEREGIKK
jgi:excisionase family DNA binding protein